MIKVNIKKNIDIFKKEIIDGFTINNLFEFLDIHLKNNNYSIIKRDITNYNLYIEILNTFNEFNYLYINDVDVKILC